MMKKITLGFLILLSIQSIALQKEGPPLYEVLYTYDGDTIKAVGVSGDTIKIRFNGIDCPEKGTPFSEKARQLTDSLSHLSKIEVVSTGQDRYGRTLADLYVNSGGRRIHINLVLVERGLAWHYKRYDNRDFIAKAEASARQAKRGLWSMANPTPPWEYRADKRN